jgi:hypothetical protein
MANTGKALHELTGKDFDERASAEMQALYKEIVKKLVTNSKGKR